MSNIILISSIPCQKGIIKRPTNYDKPILISEELADDRDKEIYCKASNQIGAHVSTCKQDFKILSKNLPPSMKGYEAGRKVFLKVRETHKAPIESDYKLVLDPNGCPVEVKVEKKEPTITEEMIQWFDALKPYKEFSNKDYYAGYKAGMTEGAKAAIHKYHLKQPQQQESFTREDMIAFGKIVEYNCIPPFTEESETIEELFNDYLNNNSK